MKRPLLIEIDKSQAEWVIVAYLAKDPEMLRVVQGNLDPHTTTGYLISGVPHELIIKEAELLGHLSGSDEIEKARKEAGIVFNLDSGGFIPRNMTVRQMGKKSNHALDYDMSARRFSLENEIPERDSKRIVALYHAGYPGIRQTFHTSVKRALEDDRVLTNCFGRRRRFLGQWSDTLCKEAYAFIPQSTVADIINKAYCIIYEKEVPKNTFIPITQVHDSILVEAYYRSTQELYDGLHRMEEYMTPTLHYNGMDFTIDTDIKAGYSWGEKDMHPLSLENYSNFQEQLAEIETEA